MRAIVHTRYGTPDVLRYAHVDRPEPQGNKVLVRIEAASLNAADLLGISGKPVFMRLTSTGLFRPRHTIPGSDVAGVVETCGPEARSVQPGDRVVADLSGYGRGGFAEYVSVPEVSLVKVPDSVSLEDAASAPMSAVTAFQALNGIARIRSGERVMIDGASGGVGTFAVQIAKAAGAHVTAVCGAAKTDIAREIGADLVVARNGTSPPGEGVRFDVIYAVNGRRSLAEYENALTQTGRFVMTGGTGSLTGQVILRGRRSTRPGRQVSFVSMKPDPADLTAIMNLIRDGLVRPVIDRTLPLAATAEGLRYLKGGKARGKVLVLPQTKSNKEK